MRPKRQRNINNTGIGNNRFREQALQGNLGHHQIRANYTVLLLGRRAVHNILKRVLSFKERKFIDKKLNKNRELVIVKYNDMKLFGYLVTSDLSMNTYSQDPLDDTKTMRILTLMHPDEYFEKIYEENEIEIVSEDISDYLPSIRDPWGDQM